MICAIEMSYIDCLAPAQKLVAFVCAIVCEYSINCINQDVLLGNMTVFLGNSAGGLRKADHTRDKSLYEF